MEICCFPSELSERQLTSTMTASCGAGAGSGTPAGGQPPAEARAPNVTACELLCVPFAGGGVPAPLSGFGRIRPVLGIFQGMKRARDNPKVLPAVRSAPVTLLPA